MEVLIEGVMGLAAEPGRIVMILIGCILMYLGIKKEYERTVVVRFGIVSMLFLISMYIFAPVLF